MPVFLFFFAVDFAVSQSHNSVMANMGQVCCAGSRTYVQDTIYDEFVKKSVEAAKKRTVGNPLDGKNENGAQVSNRFSLSMIDVFITENYNNNTINNNKDNSNSNSTLYMFINMEIVYSSYYYYRYTN